IYFWICRKPVEFTLLHYVTDFAVGDIGFEEKPDLWHVHRVRLVNGYKFSKFFLQKLVLRFELIQPAEDLLDDLAESQAAVELDSFPQPIEIEKLLRLVEKILANVLLGSLYVS